MRTAKPPAVALPESPTLLPSGGLLFDGSPTTPQVPAIRLPAAALIPLRIRDKQLEVLIGQIEVLDGVASSPTGGAAINPFPGEYRVPARQHRRRESSKACTPLETACEELEELGFPIPQEGIQATLFVKESVRTESRDYRVLYFVAFEQENMAVLQADTAEVNSRLREVRRQRRAMMLDGGYWERSRREKERLSPKLHHIEWRRLTEVLVESDPSKPIINAYQQQQFAAYGVKSRQIGRDMLTVLERIATLGSMQSVQEHAIENLVRTVAAAKELSEATWRAQLEEDVDIRKGVNEISLLSYNLNSLPLGASLLSASHGSEPQGFDSKERLNLFVSHIATRKFDILALQEVFSTPFLTPICSQRYLIRRLARIGYRHIVKSRPLGLLQRVVQRKWTDSGLLILSRLPIETQDDMMFPASAIGLDAGASKGCVYARVRTVERALHVFNCHLQATHTSEADYARVRSKQLRALREFIALKTHGTRDPWVLTGDFNIDAIAGTDERTGGEFGFSSFSSNPNREQSSAYDFLMQSLSPRGDLIDLGYETHGKHVCTRPPRLSFPQSAAYAFSHKYPQCLDYVFFCNGSVGSIKRIKRSTRIEKFAVHDTLPGSNEQPGGGHSPAATAAAPSVSAPGTLRRPRGGGGNNDGMYLIPLHGVWIGWGLLGVVASLSVPGLFCVPEEICKGLLPMQELAWLGRWLPVSVLLTLASLVHAVITLLSGSSLRCCGGLRSNDDGGDTGRESADDGRSSLHGGSSASGGSAGTPTRRVRRKKRSSYDYLSDHYGISTKFSAEVTYNWQNLASTLSPMADDGTPLHQQKADQLLAWRMSLSLTSAVAVAGGGYGGLQLWGADLATVVPTPAIVVGVGVLSFSISYLVRRVVDWLVLAMRRSSGPHDDGSGGSGGSGGGGGDASSGNVCLPGSLQICGPNSGSGAMPGFPGRQQLVREPPKTVYDCLVQGVELYGNLKCIGVREKRPDGDLGAYIWLSYDEVSRRAESFGSGLKRLAAELRARSTESSGGGGGGGHGGGGGPQPAGRIGRTLSGGGIFELDGGAAWPQLQPVSPHASAGGVGGASTVGLLDAISDSHTGGFPAPGRGSGTYGTSGGGGGGGGARRGLLRGDHIGIVTENCAEWVIVDHACSKYSLVSVTLETIGREFLSKLLNCSEARVIVASKAWMLEVLELYATGRCADLQFVVQIERLGYDVQVRAQELGLPIYDFEFVETNGRRNRLPVEPPNTDDVYTIVYRWHSETCEPIGWEVNHGNLAANANAFGELYRFSPIERHFSYVPMSHIGERVVLAACLQNGARIGIFMADYSGIYADVRKLRPTFLLSTPQSFSMPFSVAAAALERAPVRYWATGFALRCKRRSRQRGRCKWGRKWLVGVLDALIFRKFMAQMGGQVKRILVLSDATLNYMDHHLEKHTQLILNCPVYKALVLPEVGGFLALSSQQQQQQAARDAAASGHGHDVSCGDDCGMLAGYGMLHSALDFKLEPLGLKLGYGSDCYELLIKGPTLSKLIAPRTTTTTISSTTTKSSSSSSSSSSDATGGGTSSGGGGLRRAKPSMHRADSVTFDQLEWVHSGIICERYTEPQRGAASQSSSNWIVRFSNVAPPQRPLENLGASRENKKPEPLTMSLRIVGRVSSIIEVGPERTPLLAEEVERVYRSRSKLIRQIWCHAAAEWQQVARPREGWPTDGEGLPAIGLCAVVSVDHEEVYKWAAVNELDLLGQAQEMELLEDAATMSSLSSSSFSSSSPPFSPSPSTSRRHNLNASGGDGEAGVSPAAATPSSFRGANKEMELLCTLQQLRSDVIADLRRIHTEEDTLPPHAQVLSVHLTSEPFSATNKLQTPNFRLCRPNLLRRYGACFETPAAAGQEAVGGGAPGGGSQQGAATATTTGRPEF